MITEHERWSLTRTLACLRAGIELQKIRQSQGNYHTLGNERTKIVDVLDNPRDYATGRKVLL